MICWNGSDIVPSVGGSPKERGFEEFSTERLEKCIVLCFHRSGPSFRHHVSALRLRSKQRSKVQEYEATPAPYPASSSEPVTVFLSSS
jgi:hypothetical protein